MQRSWNRTAWDDATPLYSDNPYWTIYENTSDDNRHRFFGNVGFIILFYKKIIIVTGNAYGDTYSQTISSRVELAPCCIT